MKLRIPKNALVVLIGPSGSGKSTFAEKHFPDAIVASDTCRRLLAGSKIITSNELQAYSEGAFVLFYSWIRARLRHGFLTVADSTALRREYREALLKIAQEEHVPVVYIYFSVPMEECIRRDNLRAAEDRVGELVIKKQFSSVRQSRRWLTGNDVYTIAFLKDKGLEEVEITITEPKTGIEAGAIDVIGDVHGCYDELIELIEKLGYAKGDFAENEHMLYYHPAGRKLVFVGDLIDRGPNPYKVLEFVKRHVQVGLAHLVLSNHELKLRKYLSGRQVKIGEALAKSIADIPADCNKEELKRFLFQLKPYNVWESPAGETFVIAHAAFKPEFLGKMDKEIEDYCVFGPTKKDEDGSTLKGEDGYPIRIPWWDDYRSKTSVVYGHIVTDDVGFKPRVVRNTYGIDTACVHGHELTSLRLPEKEFTSVQAKQVYFEHRAKTEGETKLPLHSISGLLQRPAISVPDHTGLKTDLWVRGGLMDAVKAVSTRTVRPDKLIWLAPDMSPGPVSTDPECMEDPVTTAKWMFDNAPAGTELIAETKHMGSRGTWLCELKDGRWEINCWTRNGYQMFDGPMREQVYEAMQKPLDNLRKMFVSEATIFLLDSEVMPWNNHGPAWLEEQFMATAAAGHVSRFAITRACKRGGLVAEAEKFEKLTHNLKLFGDAASRYCWPVKSVSELKIAFFDILYVNSTALKLGLRSQRLRALRALQGDFTKSTDEFVVWNDEGKLEELLEKFETETSTGAEGMVLKYQDTTVWSNTPFPQRQLKVRGEDYLRIVYGPNYLDKDILAALRRDRRETSKMRMAYQQTILGLESLRRWSAGEPFEKFHECILGILAAERASVDPRL